MRTEGEPTTASPCSPAYVFHARMIPMFFKFYDARREYMSFPQEIIIDRMAEINDVR